VNEQYPRLYTDVDMHGDVGLMNEKILIKTWTVEAIDEEGR
jgi:hypothetical protein